MTNTEKNIRQLLFELAEEVRSLKSYVDDKRKLELEGYLSSKRVMEILNLSRASFDRLTRKVRIYKIGGKVYLKEGELLEHLKNGKK